MQSVKLSLKAKENLDPNRILSQAKTKIFIMSKSLLQVLQLISNVVFLLEKHVSSQAFFTFFPGFSHKIILDILQGQNVYISEKGQHFFFFFAV